MTTKDVIPAYAYAQFADDENITAWFSAFNTYAQQYLDWFNDTPLFDYTNTAVQDGFLDWMAEGVYGCYRTPIPYGDVRDKGPLNTYTPNDIPFNTRVVLSNLESFTMTDDVFRRVITWNFYKGDGMQFSIHWLKRRVNRFIGGPDDNTYSVSVSVSSHVVTIKITDPDNYDSNLLNYLESVVNLGYVNLPFNYTFNVETS